MMSIVLGLSIRVQGFDADRFSFTEAVDHMRAHLSHHSVGSSNEQKAAGGSIRRSDISIRYKQHEAVIHNRDLSKSNRYVCLFQNSVNAV